MRTKIVPCAVKPRVRFLHTDLSAPTVDADPARIAFLSDGAPDPAVPADRGDGHEKKRLHRSLAHAVPHPPRERYLDVMADSD